MNNDLEKFINDNRSQFDSEEMNTNWEKIKSGMEYKKTPLKKIQYYWWAAAAGILIIVSSIVFFNTGNKTASMAVKEVDLPSKEMTDHVDPEYTELMDQFAIVIKVKQTELKRNQKTQPELYSQFLKDNSRLDSSYSYLKSQLSANPNKEILLDAMIENLQLKIDVLNRQLKIIKQSKNKKANNENKTI